MRGARAGTAALAAVGVLALAGCSGGGGNDSAADSGGSTASGAMGSAPDAGGGQADRAGAGDAAAVRARPAARVKAVIRTGRIELTSRHPGRVRAELDDLLRATGGSVDDEQTSNDDDGAVRSSTLVLRVPVDRFDATRKAIMRLGKVTRSTESGRDVTTEVIDVDERVQTLQNSLDRLQRFQRTARDVRDLLRYENEITARQAELRSTKSQQAYLADQTSMSTITLTLELPRRHHVEPGALDDAGFLSGLGAGWTALGALAVVVVTVLGAALPFVVVLALVGVPLWVLLRRRGVTASRDTPQDA